MLEKDIENLIANYPEEFFPGEGFKLINQQVSIEGRRIDILFEDKHNRQIIVEVKRGILTREASGQIAEYYGLLKNADPTKKIELILCANTIPKERRTFLETIGIDCKELGFKLITDLAHKYNYKFLDDQPVYPTPIIGENPPKQGPLVTEEQPLEDQDEISVWLFQANPNRYDILNALGDPEIGNQIHWLVNQYRNRIHKNHLALIWMSGKEAGIYALARIECEPILLREFQSEKKYWLGEYEKELEIRVRLTVINNLINKPIFKQELLKIPGLSKLSILKQFQGTNFPVKDTEWKIVSRLL